MLADAEGWNVWFLRLSGWPIFLTVSGAAMAFALLLSVALQRLAHRSVVQNALVAVLALALFSFLLLVAAVMISRWW